MNKYDIRFFKKKTSGYEYATVSNFDSLERALEKAGFHLQNEKERKEVRDWFSRASRGSTMYCVNGGITILRAE